MKLCVKEKVVRNFLHLKLATLLCGLKKMRSMQSKLCDHSLTHAMPERLKPSPHHQQCRSSIVECYKVECCFNTVERCRFWQQCRSEATFYFVAKKATMLNKFFVKFLLLTKSKQIVCFDFVERSKFCSKLFQNGKNVEATFDFVEKSSNCSIRQCCSDIIAGVDGAIEMSMIYKGLRKATCFAF